MVWSGIAVGKMPGPIRMFGISPGADSGKNCPRIQAGLQRATITVASTLQPPASANQAIASWTGSILSV